MLEPRVARDQPVLQLREVAVHVRHRQLVREVRGGPEALEDCGGADPGAVIDQQAAGDVVDDQPPVRERLSRAGILLATLRGSARRAAGPGRLRTCWDCGRRRRRSGPRTAGRGRRHRCGRSSRGRVGPGPDDLHGIDRIGPSSPSANTLLTGPQQTSTYHATDLLLHEVHLLSSGQSAQSHEPVTIRASSLKSSEDSHSVM